MKNQFYLRIKIMEIIYIMNEIYNRVKEIHESKNDYQIKLLEISKIINQNNKIITTLFNSINNTKKIKLSYQNTTQQLIKLIKSESDELIKLSLIITYLHHVIYEIMGQDENCYFTLDGNEEMIIPEKITYYVYLSMKPEQNSYVYLITFIFSFESFFHDRFYIGIDYEYTGGKNIQLYQINYEHPISKQKFIMIFNPKDLDDYMMESFVSMVICNRNIKKILHGADPLDLPYTYKEMLNDDFDKIIKFTKSMVDTRYYCDYYKATYESSDVKCMIYDDDPTKSGIYTFGLISDESQNRLAEILISLPPERQWNIKRMTKSETLYTLYDTLFLKYFYYKIISKAIEHEKTPEAEKSTMFFYKNVLSEVSQFATLESKKITGLTLKCKEEVDLINNYMIRKNNKTIKLIEIYNKASQEIEITNPKVSIDTLIKVTYFKTPISLLIKKIIYTILTNKYRIYQNKLKTYDTRLSNKFIYEYFDTYEFFVLKKIFEEIELFLESKIKMLY